MNFLKQERATLEALLPGLEAALRAQPFLEMERPGSPALAAFRRLGGPGLLIPASLGGRGATPLQAARVQRAVASRSPSLAVATTMHHFSVASVLEITPDQSGPAGELLATIAGGNLYLASGFAEGRTGASVLSSTMRVERGPHGLVLNGSKKPCSLSRSMDLLTASVALPAEMGGGLAVAVIPADAPGIERRPFWQSDILAGAESDEVVLRDVPLTEQSLFPAGGPGQVDAVQDRSFLWFELLIAASYLGIASALVERILLAGKGNAAERVRAVAELDGAMAALEGVARAMLAGERGNDDLARILLTRYAVQGAIDRATSLAVELLGGMAFIQSPEVAYLLAASRALAFHPPSRLATAQRLDAYLSGAPLVLD